MVDYKKDTGSSGEMMIRDTGSVIEFWINSHNSTTFQNALPWGYTVNGTTNNDRETRYSAGAGWVKLGSWTVTTDQTVRFRLNATGTSGFGGPTNFDQFIERASAPAAPSAVTFSSLGSTTVHVTFTDGANNGASIDNRQIAHSQINNPSGATHVTSDRSTTITGLVPGVLYYFWARTHNAKGWSAYSPVRSVRMLKVPDAPDPVVASDPTQTAIIVSFTDNGDGGSPIVERQIVHSMLNDPSGATHETYPGVMVIDGLQPATTYYLWGRVRNSAGWSPYSPVVVERTVAGAYVKVGAEWKEAVPYVRVDGVWTLARAWGRYAGVYKRIGD